MWIPKALVRRAVGYGLLALAIGVPVCAGCQGLDAKKRGQYAVDEVARILIGTFSSSAQAEEDPEYYPIRLRHLPIWKQREDGPWLYVEQAVATAPERPYRQRVYHLVATARGVRSDVYSLPGDPLVFAQATAAEFETLRPGQLELREGCSIYLELGVRGHWVGSTQGAGCGSTLRGATYATSEVDLHEDRLTTWDRGFDDKGDQVWGAVKGPYVFVRQGAER